MPPTTLTPLDVFYESRYPHVSPPRSCQHVTDQLPATISGVYRCRLHLCGSAPCLPADTQHQRGKTNRGLRGRWEKVKRGGGEAEGEKITVSDRTPSELPTYTFFLISNLEIFLLLLIKDLRLLKHTRAHVKQRAKSRKRLSIIRFTESGAVALTSTSVVAWVAARPIALTSEQGNMHVVC